MVMNMNSNALIIQKSKYRSNISMRIKYLKENLMQDVGITYFDLGGGDRKPR